MDWHRQNDEIGKSSLLRGVGFAILCSVAMQWEVEYPHHNENETKQRFHAPQVVYGVSPYIQPACGV